MKYPAAGTGSTQLNVFKIHWVAGNPFKPNSQGKRKQRNDSCVEPVSTLAIQVAWYKMYTYVHKKLSAGPETEQRIAEKEANHFGYKYPHAYFLFCSSGRQSWRTRQSNFPPGSLTEVYKETGKNTTGETHTKTKHRRLELWWVIHLQSSFGRLLDFVPRGRATLHSNVCYCRYFCYSNFTGGKRDVERGVSEVW